jgi:hypothetical protein
MKYQFHALALIGCIGVGVAMPRKMLFPIWNVSSAFAERASFLKGRKGPILQNGVFQVPEIQKFDHFKIKTQLCTH